MEAKEIKWIKQDEVEKHNKPNDAWLIIHKRVYDVSSWKDHPGGSVIYTHAGEDATDIFTGFHSHEAFSQLNKFYIGNLVATNDSKLLNNDWQSDPEQEESIQINEKKNNKMISSPEFIKAYRNLRNEINRMGLFKASISFYLWKLLSNLLLLSLAFILTSRDNIFIKIIGTITLGLFYQQCGWLAHDFLHHQVFKRRLYGDLAGIFVGNVLQGFSVQWWKNKHNQHHAVPNLHDCLDDKSNISKNNFIFKSGDPDIDTLPLLAWSIDMAKNIRNSKLGIFMVKNQSYFYFPILLFARISWLLQSIIYVCHSDKNNKFKDPVIYKKLEIFGLILHYSWNLIFFYLMSHTIFEGIIYFLISQMSAGILLALVFSVGHNGMAVYSNSEYKENISKKPDFWNFQVTTTRNITGSIFINWFMGGLQYQVDHHLFPTLPRHNLATVNILVKSFCKKYNVPYYETGFLKATWEVLNHLGNVTNEFLMEFPAM